MPKTKKKSAEEDVFVVEKILDKRGRGRNLKYLIKWKDYGDDQNSWERVANCGCPDLIKEFETAHAQKQKEKRAKNNGRRIKRKTTTDTDSSSSDASAAKKKKTNNNDDDSERSSVEPEAPVIAPRKIIKAEPVQSADDTGTSSSPNTTHEDLQYTANSKDDSQDAGTLEEEPEAADDTVTSSSPNTTHEDLQYTAHSKDSQDAGTLEEEPVPVEAADDDAGTTSSPDTTHEDLQETAHSKDESQDADSLEEEESKPTDTTPDDSRSDDDTAHEGHEDAGASEKDVFKTADDTTQEEELQDAETSKNQSQDTFEDAKNTEEENDNPHRESTSSVEHPNGGGDATSGNAKNAEKEKAQQKHSTVSKSSTSQLSNVNTPPQTSTATTNKEEEPSRIKPASEHEPLTFIVKEIEDFIGDFTDDTQRVLVRLTNGKREIAELKAVANQNIDIAFDFLISHMKP